MQEFLTTPNYPNSHQPVKRSEIYAEAKHFAQWNSASPLAYDLLPGLRAAHKIVVPESRVKTFPLIANRPGPHPIIREPGLTGAPKWARELDKTDKDLGMGNIRQFHHVNKDLPFNDPNRNDVKEWPNQRVHFERHGAPSNLHAQFMPRKGRGDAAPSGYVVDAPWQAPQFSMEDTMTRKGRPQPVQRPIQPDADRIQEFFKYGSTVSTSQFWKAAGSGNGLRVTTQAQKDLKKVDHERSNRSDRFGFAEANKKAEFGVKIISDKSYQDKQKSYMKTQFEQSRRSEIDSVKQLPKEVPSAPREAHQDPITYELPVNDPGHKKASTWKKN